MYQRELIDLPLANLPPNEDLPSPEPTASFVKDVRENGLRRPIDVTEEGAGWYVLAGIRRIKTLRQLELETIPAIWVKAVPLLARLSWVTSDNRFSTSNEIRDAQLVRRLEGEHKSDTEIALTLSLTKTEIVRLKKIGALPQELLRGAEEGKIAMGTLKTMATWTAGQCQKAVEVFRVTKKLTGEDLKELRQVARTEIAETLEFQLPDMDLPDVSRPGEFIILDGTSEFGPRIFSSLPDALAAKNGGYVYRLEKVA